MADAPKSATLGVPEPRVQWAPAAVDHPVANDVANAIAGLVVRMAHRVAFGPREVVPAEEIEAHTTLVTALARLAPTNTPAPADSAVATPSNPDTQEAAHG